jgi:hypothetical protein
MALFLLRPEEFEIQKDKEVLAKRGLNDIKSNPQYWSWNDEK